MSDYKLERISSNTYKFIKSLYKDCFNVDRNTEYINTKYNTTSFKHKDIGFFAIDKENKPAGYYGVFPITAIYNGNSLNIAQSGDTMTHPNHRKKGLFTILAKETYDLAKNENLAFVFGFPNENSLPGFQKNLNWVFHGYMKQFTFKSNTIPLAELSYKLKLIRLFFNLVSKLRLKSIIVETNINNIKDFKSSENEFKLSRNIDFFNYKKYGNPFIVKLNGFTIYLKIDDHLKIGDVSFFDENQTLMFVKTIKILGQKSLSGKIILAVSENHWLFDRLNNHITSINLSPIGFLPLNGDYPLDKMTFTGADFDTF